MNTRSHPPVPKQVGMDLFYNQYGRDDPPLIILHGLLGANGNWHTLSRTAFKEVATVYAVDQRNHGRSPHTNRMDYAAMAADIREFVERHDLGRVSLLGHSMGGKTAMKTALSYPEVVDRLIVADMTPKAYEARHEGLLDALAGIDPSSYDAREEIDTALAEDIPSRPVRQFLLKNLHYDGETYSWQMNLDAIQTHYENINAALPGDEVFEGPTMVVRGEASDYVQDDDMPAIRERFPNARLETLDGAGHWVHADAPEAFSEAVVDFLTED